MSSEDLYGLRLFQLVELARKLAKRIAVTSDRVLASMFSQTNGTASLAPDMTELASQTRELETVLAELRQRSEAWISTHLP